MRERNVRLALVIVELFLAVSAFVGAVGLVAGYMNIPLSVLYGTPFADFTVPALLLAIVVGGSALVAVLIALFGPTRLALFGPWRFDVLASAAAGCIMVGWMIVEVALVGLATWVQVLYLAIGLLIIGLAVLLQMAEPHQIGVRGRHHAHAA
jgi:hypothetical protein